MLEVYLDELRRTKTNQDEPRQTKSLFRMEQRGSRGQKILIGAIPFLLGECPLFDS